MSKSEQLRPTSIKTSILKTLRSLLILVLLLSLSTICSTQGVLNGVVKIIVESNLGEETGSGIIVGRKGNQLFIVTANHVVEGGNTITVSFKEQSWAPLQARLNDSYNDDLDLAVLIVDVPEEVVKGHKFKLADVANLKKEQKVNSIGHPGDLSWVEDKEGVISNPKHMSFNVVYASPGVSSGYSGGPLLLKKKNQLAGMILEVSTNQVTAVRIDHVLTELDNWNIPYQHISPYKPPVRKSAYVFAVLSAGASAAGLNFHGNISENYDTYQMFRDPTAPLYQSPNLSRDEVYDKAKRNQLYRNISFGVAGVTTLVALILSLRKTKAIEQGLTFFLEQSRYTPYGVDMGLAYKF